VSNGLRNPTRGQVRQAKLDAMLEQGRAYVTRLQTGLDASEALRELGAAVISWRHAEIACAGQSRKESNA
jgi:hypothetical protein